MRWELNALVIESIVLGGVAMAAVIAAARRFAPAIPAFVPFAIGILAVGVVVWPAIRVLTRPGHGSSTVGNQTRR